MTSDNFKIIKKAINKGLLHIFSANFLNKVIQFGTSIVLIRILTKESYGQWTYAMNILGIFLLMNGLGTTSGVLQYSSEKEEEEEKISYLKYGLKIGILFSLFIATIIYFYTYIFPLPVKGSTNILRLLSLMPLFTTVYGIIQVYLRARLKNKKFLYITLANTISFFFFSTTGALYLDKNGIVMGRYITYSISIFVGLKFIKKELKVFKKINYPPKKSKKDFMKYSIVSMLSNAISSMLYLIDTLIVGLIFTNGTVVASYKTATLIPFNLNFIPLSIITFSYPYFAKNSKDKKRVRMFYIKMMKYLILLNSTISIILFLFAPTIIRIVFGKSYADSIVPFRILSIGYFIAGTFRIPAGNVLASQKKIKVNLYNAIISGIANIILDIVLIRKYGPTGAALSTVSIFIISSIISNIFLFKYLKIKKNTNA